MATAEPSLDTLHSAIQFACQPQNASRIVRGRQQVLALPRSWVLAHIERVAAAALDLSDDWEYRRLLELAALLDAGLLQRLVQFGLASSDHEVPEAAQDFFR
jgi:hypothetical protein